MSDKNTKGGYIMTTILGIKLSERDKDAMLFQEIITKHGCNIKTRIGLHQSNQDYCSNNGIILLELIGENQDLKKALNQHWETKSIEL